MSDTEKIKFRKFWHQSFFNHTIVATTTLFLLKLFIGVQGEFLNNNITEHTGPVTVFKMFRLLKNWS